jgi:hypothetical protein
MTLVLMRSMLALRMARYTEPFVLLVWEIAYNGQGCPEIAYRFERFNYSAVR